MAKHQAISELVVYLRHLANCAVFDLVENKACDCGLNAKLIALNIDPK